jgi:hypothetical protein
MGNLRCGRLFIDCGIFWDRAGYFIFRVSLGLFFGKISRLGKQGYSGVVGSDGIQSGYAKKWNVWYFGFVPHIIDML